MTHATSSRRRRKWIRLKQYDYTQPGAYFVTICTHDRAHLFGRVVDQTVALSSWGQMADWQWRNLPQHFEQVRVDVHVVMPNHLHGIIWIGDDPVETIYSPPPAPQTGVTSGSLGAIVGTFKSLTARRINQMRQTPGIPVWQRNYFEHIIRTEHALHAIRRYIHENPQRCSMDRYHPEPQGIDPRALEIWRMLRA